MQRLIKITIVVGTLSLLAVPFGTSYAVNGNSANGQSCSRFDNILNKISSDADTRAGNLEKKRQTGSTNITKDRAEADNKIKTSRQGWDTKWKGMFAKLEAKATTDEQKTAVQTFETAIKDAVTTRRAAFDANRVTFRTGVDTAIANHKSAVSGAVTTLKSEYAAAVAKAQANCASGTAYKDVANQLKADLAAARDKFKSSKVGTENVGQQVKRLADARNQADKAATKTFNDTVKAATTALKQAFGSQEI